MAVKIIPSIFREYDVRGIAGRDLTEDFAFLLGQAYAEMFREKLKLNKVAVGRDCRLTSDAYGAALMSGIRSQGVDVIDLGVCATPLTYFSLFHLEIDGAIMVTGSHNPSDYNGFKICIGKGTIHGQEIQHLRTVMEKLNTPSGAVKSAKQGALSSYAIIPAYVNHLVKNAKPTKPLKIVLDSGNGTASNIAPQIFEKLGAKVIPLYCELDGRFPNHHPDPTVPANLKVLVETVIKEKAAFGVAFDGDSDRIGAVDENGRILYGDELMVILARAVLKENPGATILSEVKSSHRLYQDIARHGGNPIMWKTGHSLIKSKMKESGALLAGEMSGHIFFADRNFGYDDAIYAALRLFEIASQHNGPVSSLLQGLPDSVSTPEIRVDCIEEKKFELVQKTKEEILKKISPTDKVIDIDGIRVDFPDGWGLVRASNTQPVLVVRFEAISQARLLAIRSIVESALNSAAKQIGHPVPKLDDSH